LKRKEKPVQLREKRRLERAKEVLRCHPDYARIALERAYGSGKSVVNLVKDVAWLRGIEHSLDEVVLDYLTRNGYVAPDGNRYGITGHGQQFIAGSA
jgi:hypothetical protein